MTQVFLVFLALVQLAFCQFGGFGGQNCDYNRLQQASQREEQCNLEFYELKMQALSAIQRSDRMCFQGISDAVQQCTQPIADFRQQNDLDLAGIYECCFPGRVGGFGSSRRCEFRNKECPLTGKKGKKGPKGGGSHEKGGPGGPPGMNKEEMKRKWMNSLTLAELSVWGAAEKVEMVEKMVWCPEENRMINDQAMDSFKQYKDQLIAKVFQCSGMIIPEITNCTDANSQDIECIIKGVGWIGTYMKACFEACHPQSLETFCRMATSVSQGGQTQNYFNSNNNNNYNNNNYRRFP